MARGYEICNGSEMWSGISGQCHADNVFMTEPFNFPAAINTFGISKKNDLQTQTYQFGDQLNGKECTQKFQVKSAFQSSRESSLFGHKNTLCILP